MQPHRISWSSLVFGLLFAGAGVLLITNGVSLVTRLDWIGPIVLILVALCLFASAVGDRARHVQAPPLAVPPVPGAGAPESSGAGTPSAGAEASAGEPLA
jgi:hypothetical protein